MYNYIFAFSTLTLLVRHHKGLVHLLNNLKRFLWIPTADCWLTQPDAWKEGVKIGCLHVYRKLVVMWRELVNQIHMHMFLCNISFSTKGTCTVPQKGCHNTYPCKCNCLIAIKCPSSHVNFQFNLFHNFTATPQCGPWGSVIQQFVMTFYFFMAALCNRAGHYIFAL